MQQHVTTMRAIVLDADVRARAGHQIGLEIITRPYGSGPRVEQTDMDAARVQTESERGDEADD